MGIKEDRAMLRILRTARKQKTLVSHGGILISEAARDDYKSQFCQGCGQRKTNPKVYCGQEFCGECVEKWKAGYR